MRETQRSRASEKRDAETPGMRLRICVLGPFDIAWQGPDTPFPKERLTGRGAAPALGLLKALLSQPDRFATRDWLLEQFWPESAVSSAQARLDDVASGLRSLLRPPGNTAKWLHYVYSVQGRGSGYRLEGYPMIWADADAFTWCIEQAARMERFGHNALPLWEQAYALGSRGPFLPEEIYSDWAQARREELAGQYRQCVHRLCTLLRERGATEQALLCLRTYWQVHPTDQDILRPLMEILGEQERYQEAEDYYQQLLLTLSEVEEHPRAPDEQTQDIREFLRTKQLRQRSPMASPGEAATLPQATQALSPNPSSPSPDDFAQVMASDIIKAVHERGGTATLDRSRRDLLQQALPFLFGVSRMMRGTSAANLFPSFDDPLSFYSTAIPACWILVYNGGIEYIEKVLPTYLAHLITLTQQSPHDRKQAATLTSQGYKLANLLDLRREDFGTALQHSKEAFFYGQIAEDPNLQGAALIEEALTFWYRKRLPQTFSTYQKALQLIEHSKEISPIIKGRIYMGLAVAYAGMGQKQEALRYAGLGYDTFPEYPEGDLHFSYTHYSRYYLHLYEGYTYTILHQPENALMAYTHFQAQEYISRRAEIANREAAALLTLGDLDQCGAKVETAVALALSTKSDLRYSEAREIYQGMLIKWPHEKTVKDLGQLFQ